MKNGKIRFKLQPGPDPVSIMPPWKASLVLSKQSGCIISDLRLGSKRCKASFTTSKSFTIAGGCIQPIAIVARPILNICLIKVSTRVVSPQEISLATLQIRYLLTDYMANGRAYRSLLDSHPSCNLLLSEAESEAKIVV